MTAEQSYAKHAHRPVLSNVAGALALVALISLAGAWLAGWDTRDVGIVSLAMAVVVLVSISRIYIVRLQDRIILLEMKVRGAELLTPEQEAMLASLQRRQIIALRFASDDELPALVERAAREPLTPDQIKRDIKRWRADHLRT
jgi:hypothetical protein